MAEAATFPGVRKAAIALITLGDQASAAIIRELTEDEVHIVSREVARMDKIPAEEAESVLEEFHRLVAGGEPNPSGGAHFAKKMLEAALGPEPAHRILGDITQPVSTVRDRVGVDALQKADPQQLASFIQNEHPQTIALVLSNLKPAQAGSLLMSLPLEIRSEVARRLANLDQVSPKILNRIASVVAQKLNAIGGLGRRSSGGLRAVADLLNQLERAATEDILQNIAQGDPELADGIRHLMFVFEDLLTIEKEGMKVLVGKIDRKLLIMALKGTSAALKAHFFQCMSQRGAEMMKEDMDSLGPVRLRDVQAAQQQVIAIVQKLQEEGVLSSKGGGGEEYVV